MQAVDRELLQRFEAQLDPARPEAGEIPVKVLGYGEMSCIFALEQIPGVALKRLPPFPDRSAFDAFRQATDDYVVQLRSLDINVIAYDWYDFDRADGYVICYMASPMLQADHFGNRRLTQVPATVEGLRPLMEPLLAAYLAVYRHNQQGDTLLGIDGQISNWSFADLAGSTPPVYIDFATPLMRRNEEELLDPELFLAAVPSFLRWFVRWQFLDEVLDRYYDLRLVLVDLLANFVKEKQEDKIAPALTLCEQYLAEAHISLEPISLDDIHKYYKDDAFIWKIFLALRRFDRFLATRLLRKRYEFILPGNIDR